MHRQHDRVPDRVRADHRLHTEHVRLAGAGHRRPAGSTQLWAGVLHARGGRPARADGVRRTGMAGVRPESGLAVRVARRRRFRCADARPATRAGPVRGLLLRHRGTPPVRHDRTGERTVCKIIISLLHTYIRPYYNGMANLKFAINPKNNI